MGGDGTEILILSKGGTAEKLAKAAYNEIVPKLNNGRGIKERTNLGILKRTNMPAILIEGAFLDSDDRFAIDELHEQKAFGVAAAHGILKHYGIKIKPVAEPPKPSDSCDKIHRVKVDGKQIGAYKNHKNVLDEVDKALKSGKKIEVV